MSTIGTVELIATIDTSQYKRGAAEIDRTNKDLEGSGEKSSGRLNSAFGTVAKVGLAAVAAAAIAVGAVIVSNIGAAIKRVDTLNNSSRTFANLGFDAKTVDSSMKALTKSIQGLPTPLDAAVRGVQLIASSTNDLGKSQKIFSAINNAVIGFGGTSEDVTNSVLQLSQAFSGGRIDAQTWNSMLANNLGPTLNAIARSMGITTQQLKEGLSDGSISVSDFQDALIKLNEKGGGGIKSLQQISKDATSGIGTGWENLNTAIQRGITSVIDAIGSENIAKGISATGKAFESALGGITAGIQFIKDNWPAVQGVIDSVKNSFLEFWNTIKPLRDFLGGQFKIAWQDLTNAFGQLQTALQPFMPQIRELAKIIGVLLLVPLAILIGLFVAAAVAISVVAAAVARLIGWFAEAYASAVSFATQVWQAIQTMWQVVTDAVQGIWNSITSVFSAVGQWFSDRFNDASNRIKSAFGGLIDWFRNLWNQIVGLFSSVGTTVGNAIGNAFKSVVNSVIRGAVNVINGFIRSINGIVGAVNKLPGPDIGKIGELPIPQLAQGGIVTSPTLAMVGEGRESEAVIPLSKLDSMISDSSKNTGRDINITVNLSGVMTDSKAGLREVGKQIIGAVNDELRSNGARLIGGGAI